MKILQNIINESGQYYKDIKRKLEAQIACLPKGSIKERNISGGKYYYHQFREGEKIIHKYIGKGKPEGLISGIKKRQGLQGELKKVKEALHVIKMSKGRKRDRPR